MSLPLISCIIPTFNSEKYLADTIKSILAQTYRPIEVIIADDGSSDGTKSVAEQFGHQVLFYSQATKGPAATRNFGLSRAKGEFVAFLDGDDLWHEEKLVRQMTRFQENPDLDISVTHAKLFWPESLADEKAQYADHPRANGIPGYATTTLLARRSVFDKIGIFDTQFWFGDATDWFMRANESGMTMELLPDVLTYHRMHESNLTRRRKEDSREEFLKIVKQSLDRRRKKVD